MRRIVVIESDEKLGFSIKQHLSRQGYEVEHVHRPCAVSNALRLFSPDIVLTELFDSGQDDKGLPCILTKSCDKKCPFKLVLFSSADEATQQKIINSGLVDGRLDKNTPLERLGEAIESLYVAGPNGKDC